ncbi:MAG: hypothetical protein D6790_17040 [Caldilineae bacterium]|nr:MAG: hypothetical protein D6790_17040 [Caldilineae bacterium]
MFTILADRFQVTPAARPGANLLYAWTLLLAGFTLLLGVGHVLWVHVKRVLQGGGEWPLSLLLVAGFGVTLIAGMVGGRGVTAPLVEWLFDAVIAPVQASLFALTGVFLLLAAFRYLRLDREGGFWIMAGALLTLAVQTPIAAQALPDLVLRLVDWLLVWPVMAALRGAVLGGALAAVLLAFRYLIRSR